MKKVRSFLIIACLVCLSGIAILKVYAAEAKCDICLPTTDLPEYWYNPYTGPNMCRCFGGSCGYEYICGSGIPFYGSTETCHEKICNTSWPGCFFDIPSN
jgi:hypothetical protein